MNQKEFIKSGKYLIDDVKNRASKNKSHFFDNDTIRFFSSRISDLCWKVKEDIYFITSEQDKSNFKHSGSIRGYTIRKCTLSGDIQTISKFQEYGSLYDARKKIKEIIQ